VLRTLDLVLRFVLELTALWLAGTWGWIAHDDPWRWILAIALPAIAAALWGTFRIPGDPKPEPPVPVGGLVRLAIEAIVMVTPVVLIAPYRPTTAWIVGGALAVHYTIGGRLLWLVRHARRVTSAA
jgi:hypothetical protein